MSAGADLDHYQAKANFDDVYNQPDPRQYYRTLGVLNYEIPAHGALVFDLLLDEMGGREGRTVLDVCCGYSANAALLNHDVNLAELYEHYGSLASAADGDIAEIDRQWFAERGRADAVSVIGLDIAGNAVRYAASVGLLNKGVVADLESGDPDEETVRALAAADLVAVTGGIGYVGEKTFRSVIEASGEDPPWVAALSLRWVDFSPIAETFDDLGLVTERLEGYCVPQRRFAHDSERQAALAGLRARGLDPAPELRLGAHCAELYVSRPPEAARAAPLADVLGFLAAS
jgi:SAM-dependent methyltransferase